MTTPACHPDRKHHANGQCARCYFADVYTRTGRRARPRKPRPSPGTFPIKPILSYAGSFGHPISIEEMSYRTGIYINPDATGLTDLEADHLAVALGGLPGDIWRELWEDFDGPHYDNPQPDVFGPTTCDCFACGVHFARAV